jgi:peptidoglycan/LPS O-acetylase OafA/YrhL
LAIRFGYAPNVQTAEEPSTPAATPVKREAGRLLFLDGLRGFAALYVVFHHAFIESPSQHGSLACVLSMVLGSGRFAVDVFIAISGFCLMLPIAFSVNRQIKSVGGFYQRRARRILPPYYAAVGISLLLAWLVPGLAVKRGVHWDITQPAFTPASIVSHLLLIHNLRMDLIYRINHALWSVATEIQIYVLFPILLIPVWRRFGNVVAFFFATAIGLSIFYLLPGTEGARPWYLSLFAMGMCGAAIFADSGRSDRPVRSRAIALVSFAITVLIVLLAARWSSERRLIWIPDLLVGAGAVAVMVYCAHRERAGQSGSPVIVVLDSKPIVWLGVISYSVYLIHPPVIAICYLFLHRLRLSPTVELLSMLIFATGLAVLAGWIFHVVIERRFIPRADPRVTATAPRTPAAKQLVGALPE